MKLLSVLALALGIAASAACASSGPAPMTPASRVEPTAHVPRARDRLWRQDVVTTVDRGLGQFLQHVEVEPSLQSGRFVGFRITALQPAEYWTGVDLGIGDVVTRVNGHSIERDSDAYAAFQSLKTASELRVTFLRGGQERELVIPIVGDSPSPSAPSPATVAPSPAAAPSSPAAHDAG
ncbi:MAG: PDZ domain-containing protein [Polyangiaceae bacterium]